MSLRLLLLSRCDAAWTCIWEYNIFIYKSYMYIYLNVCKQMTDVTLLHLHSKTWNHLTVRKQMINSK